MPTPVANLYLDLLKERVNLVFGVAEYPGERSERHCVQTFCQGQVEPFAHVLFMITSWPRVIGHLYFFMPDVDVTQMLQHGLGIGIHAQRHSCPFMCLAQFPYPQKKFGVLRESTFVSTRANINLDLLQDSAPRFQMSAQGEGRC
ncbi:hypothetical protein SLS62_006897 [Diatrype stigma]|uniref:Uncharacterized protein n=1 Tax=Diatrype stigma TaxID=117547 RepID=A0AAN9UNQ1_9PEZI